MEIKSWDDMNKKYTEYRDDMTEEREKEFVEDCYTLYEKEGFAKKFWSMGGDFPQYKGKEFTVIERVKSITEDKENGADLECLPMWNIKFADGFEMAAYPDEIIPSQMKDNGCNIKEYV